MRVTLLSNSRRSQAWRERLWRLLACLMAFLSPEAAVLDAVDSITWLTLSEFERNGKATHRKRPISITCRRSNRSNRSRVNFSIVEPLRWRIVQQSVQGRFEEVLPSRYERLCSNGRSSEPSALDNSRGLSQLLPLFLASPGALLDEDTALLLFQTRRVLTENQLVLVRRRRERLLMKK